MKPGEDQSENEPEPGDIVDRLPDEIDWDVLAGHVEGFLEGWEANGFGPLLSDHLPTDNAHLRRAVLIELIKVDLEYRCNSDGPVLLLEDYLDEHPELGQPDGMPAELIFEEYHLRCAAGETVDVQDCLARFPDQAAEIAKHFQLEPAATESMSGSELTESFHPGERIGDFYLMSNLGAGAFGSVFLARQESMQRMVALKISGDKGTEGQTLAQLDHPNIVRVHDQTRLADQNLRLLYMQFAAGGTLQSVIKESRRREQKTGRIVAECIAAAVDRTGVLSAQSIPLKGGIADRTWSEVTCQLGSELAQALHYAHGRGILHRDIKPANVLLDANGTAKLADFNISFSSQVEGTTPAAYFGGSLAYMSPEQLEAFDPSHPMKPDDLDGRADIFSLGVLLWELMYGERPFDDESVSGESPSEILTKMVDLRRSFAPIPPVTPTTAVESQLYSVLCRCLTADPAKRFQNASELAQELGLCLQPRVAELLNESQSGWRSFAIAWPLAAFLLTAILPHVPAAVFNFAYNDQTIIEGLRATSANPQKAQAAFTGTVVFINVIAFSIGIAACVWYSSPVRKLLRQKTVSINDVLSSRVRALRLSRFVTIVGITEWTIAGLAYPVVLHLITEDGLQARWHAHFFVSLLVCGLVAAAYPFFLTATLSVRAFLPAMLRHGRLRSADTTELARLAEQSMWSLYLAGGVPAVGIMILLTTQDAEESKLPLRVFSVLGAFGFAIALTLARSLQNDAEALQESSRMLAEMEENAGSQRT